MELEIIRACADAAADATIGLAVQIDGLTMDKIGDLKPALRAIYSYVDDPFVARKTLNLDEIETGGILLPAALIYLESAPQIDSIVRTTYREGDFPLAISFLTAESDDAKRMRDALYFNRAALRFLTQFNRDENEAMRQRNAVNFWMDATKKVQQYTPFDKWEAAVLAATTVIPFRGRETQA